MLASIIASAQVTNVAPVGANYANKTVSFRVWWNASSRDATHLAKVWVWVDYIQINSNNTTSGNTWTRATVGTISGGVTSYDGTNRNGFWLEGNVSTNYSATLTVQLTNVSNKFNWCAYASDYPPNVTANNGTYTFKGTPPFTLIASDGTITQTVSGNTLTASALTITPTTIRDKTECPGVFCIYTGSDLYVDATHPCQQRISGAKNWEAYIKDTRDEKIYHITQFSDNTWWFADDLAIADKSVGTCNGKYYYVGSNKPSCPNGWRLPSISEIWVRWNMQNCLNNATYGTDIYGAYVAAGAFYGSSQRLCGVSGCELDGLRYDLITADTVNTYYVHAGANDCGWNCNVSAHTAAGIGARARCVR
jgi:hypothetical protein